MTFLPRARFVAAVALGLALTASSGTSVRAGIGVIRGPLLDAHNCYPDEGRWTDRLSRALATPYSQIGIEQDLVWKADGQGGGVSVVAHNDELIGGEPTLEDYFFKTVAPIAEKALAENKRDTWPLIVLHFDFKTNEPAHHRFVQALLKKYERWLTWAPRVAGDDVQPMTPGPLLVLTEAGEGQERDFHATLPVGERLLIFGTVPNPRLSTSDDREQHARDAAAAPPERVLPSGATNYRRWANFGWPVIEEGGQRGAGEWTAADEARLKSMVDRAHALGLWLRIYTLDGFAPAESHGENQGWGDGYNFGSLAAVRTRWRAAIDAGLDFIATDQYEALAQELRRQP